MLQLAALKALPLKWIGLALLVAALVVQTARIDGFKFGPFQKDGLKVELADEKAARKADRKAYEEAQRQAQANNRAEVERIEKRQEEITDELRTKYQRDLDRLRAGGLRDEYKAPPGSPGKPGASSSPETACRADEQNVCVPRSVLVRAGEIELSRNALIDWINEQLSGRAKAAPNERP